MSEGGRDHDWCTGVMVGYWVGELIQLYTVLYGVQLYAKDASGSHRFDVGRVDSVTTRQRFKNKYTYHANTTRSDHAAANKQLKLTLAATVPYTLQLNSTLHTYSHMLRRLNEDGLGPGSVEQRPRSVATLWKPWCPVHLWTETWLCDAPKSELHS